MVGIHEGQDMQLRRS